jgi:uncharacterized protein YbjT (DUF2867 family)
MSEVILVTGALGNTGKPLVNLLHESGAPVRAMVRSRGDLAKLPDGVQHVVADFDDAESIAAALEGINTAYLVTPSSSRAQTQQEAFVTQAARSGVRHIVKLSQLAAAEGSPVRFLRYHAAVERQIRESGVGFTFLRPNLYLQGLLAMADSVREQGKFFAPIGDARVSAVDVRDIAAAAAAALIEPGHLGKTYTITGPAAVTHAEIAAAISEATGHRVTFIDVEPQIFADTLRGLLPDWQIDGLIEDYAHYARGEASEISSSVMDLTGRPARTVQQWARDYAAALS